MKRGNCPLSNRGHRWKPLQVKIPAGEGHYNIKTIYALRLCRCGAEGRVDNQGRVVMLSNTSN